MTMFTASGIADFEHMPGLKTLGATTHTTKGNAGFEVKTGGLFPTTVHVSGSFDYASDNVIHAGTITGMTMDLPFGGVFSFGNLSLDYADFIAGLQTSTRNGLAMMFSGADVITGSGFDDTLYGFRGDDLMHGGKGNDRLFGATGNDRILGGGGNDTFEGGAGADTLNGGAGRDKLLGGAGADKLNGGAGSDTMTGGAGADTFHFDSGLGGAPNVDTITDFKAGVDKLLLFRSVFAEISQDEAVNSEFFAIGSAKDQDDHIIYKPGSGKLFYDADGSDVGAAILFAQLDKNLSLTVDDFIVA